MKQDSAWSLEIEEKLREHQQYFDKSPVDKRLTRSPQIVLLVHVRNVKRTFAINLNVCVLRISRRNLIFDRYVMFGSCKRRVVERNRNGCGGSEVIEYARTLLCRIINNANKTEARPSIYVPRMRNILLASFQ